MAAGQLHVQVRREGKVVGEGGVCQEEGCACEGAWLYWGEGFTPQEVEKAVEVQDTTDGVVVIEREKEEEEEGKESLENPDEFGDWDF